MKDIVLNSLVKNFKDDFGFEPSFTIKKYSQFDNLLRSTLRDKTKINQLREEKLKTEAMLADLCSRENSRGCNRSNSDSILLVFLMNLRSDKYIQPVFSVKASSNSFSMSFTPLRSL